MHWKQATEQRELFLLYKCHFTVTNKHELRLIRYFMYLLREKKNIVRITKEFREVCSNENIFFLIYCSLSRKANK